MPKQTDHKACLSTLSIPPQSAPPSSPDTPGPEPPAKDTVLLGTTNRAIAAGDGGSGHQGTQRGAQERPEYLVAFAYVLIYMEVGWLILMLLRMYSRY
jgi:hypothetical protein